MNVASKSMLVIADDLTGANDTGVQFARQGLHTEVVLEGGVLPANVAAQVVIIDTNSRTSLPQEAYARVQKVVLQGKNAGFCSYYKKSRFYITRQPGSEVQAILDLKFHDFAFLCHAGFSAKWAHYCRRTASIRWNSLGGH